MANQIPADILSQIFLLCLPQHPPLYPQSLSSIKEVPLSQHKSPTPRTLEPPLVLGRVCQHWRDVSLSFGKLWTQLDVPIRTQDLQHTVEFMLGWLSRSARYPLTLSIAFYTPRVDDLGSLLDVVKPHANRLEHLELYAPRGILQLFVEAIFNSEGGLSLLRTLHLTACPVNHDPQMEPVEFHIIPQLTNLSLRGALKSKFMDISQTNLRVLCLDKNPTVDELLDYSLMCPSVEELYLFFDPFASGIEPSEPMEDTDTHNGVFSATEVEFPRVRKLRVGLGLLRTGKALRALCLPSLQHLSCGPGDQHGCDIHPHRGGKNCISLMLKWSKADLISLHIEGPHFLPLKELFSCLNRSPNLIHLSGNCSFWTREFLDLLIRGYLPTNLPNPTSTLVTSVHLVPLLEEITVHDFHSQDHLLPGLSNFILSRRLARVTFEGRECVKDVVLNNSQFQSLISAGLDVRFRVKLT